MNRRKFLKLFGGLLAALPFVKREIPKQPRLSPWSNTEVITIIPLDEYVKMVSADSNIFLFNMSAEDIEANWKMRQEMSQMIAGMYQAISE